MAITIRNTHYCERCGQPIRRTDDQVRVLRVGVSGHAHWQCFLAAMREHDQRTAAVVEEVAR